MSISNKIRNVYSRIIKEISVAKEIASVLSFKEAWDILRANMRIWQIDKGNRVETYEDDALLSKKHMAILRYLEKRITPLLDGSENTACAENENRMENVIWICWLQGLDSAPPLVQACVESIKKSAGQERVYIITEGNYREFVAIPKQIEEKYRHGKITKTQFSDILRCALLAKFGGLWLDATVYIANQYKISISQLPVWSIKKNASSSKYVTKGRWTAYCLGCNAEGKNSFAKIRDMLFYYYTFNDILVDYFLIDYLIMYAQNHDEEIRKEFSQIKESNINCENLAQLLNCEYDDNTWEKLKSNTAIFKLTWRQCFVDKIKEKDTFYAKVLKGEL